MTMTMGMMIMGRRREALKRLNLDYNAENSCLHFYHCYCFITIIVVAIVDEVDIGNDVDVERMGGKGREGEGWVLSLLLFSVSSLLYQFTTFNFLPTLGSLFSLEHFTLPPSTPLKLSQITNTTRTQANTPCSGAY